MLLLTLATHSLMLRTSATSAIDFVSSWVDVGGGAFTPGSQEGQTTTATDTTIVASQAGDGISRQIKMLTIINVGSTSNTVSVLKAISATKRICYTAVLAASECLSYVDGIGFTVSTSTGSPRVVNSGGGDFEFLGSTVLASSATSTAIVPIAARGLLMVQSIITGYGGSDIASLRFNSDSGANYWSRYLASAAGGVVWTNNVSVSATLARMFALGVTTGRSSNMSISNRLASSKCGAVSALTGTGSASTGDGVEIGGFEWINTTAQITTIQMLTAGGATLTTGSGFAVWGKNI